MPRLLDLSGLFQIHGLPGYPHLRDPQVTPQLVHEFTDAASPWAAIRAKRSVEPAGVNGTMMVTLWVG